MLKKDSMEWSQIKSQIHYKLHSVMNYDEVNDFTADIEELSQAISKESHERESDDQEIISMVNDICQKMY